MDIVARNVNFCFNFEISAKFLLLVNRDTNTHRRRDLNTARTVIRQLLIQITELD